MALNSVPGWWAVWAIMILGGAQGENSHSEVDDAGDVAWDTWRTYYNRSYEEDQVDMRHEIWENNGCRVQWHNEEVRQLGIRSYTQTLNKFADFSPTEMSLYISRLGYQAPDVSSRHRREVQDLLTATALPEYVNWVEMGAVSAVKDQGVCGSCYAFSAMGALEAAHFIATGTTLTRLSEQNIVDCSFEQGNDGCDGGNMVNSFAYVSVNGGVDNEAFYPYTSQNSGHAHHCRFSQDNVGAMCAGYITLSPKDEVNLQVAVSQYGPVSCALSVLDSFLLYSAGVYSSQHCSSEFEDLSHAVLIVGYGTTDAGQDYWLIKNSWGHSWGEGGYIRLLRGENMCGIANMCTLPFTRHP